MVIRSDIYLLLLWPTRHQQREEEEALQSSTRHTSISFAADAADAADATDATNAFQYCPAEARQGYMTADQWKVLLVEALVSSQRRNERNRRHILWGGLSFPPPRNISSLGPMGTRHITPIKQQRHLRYGIGTDVNWFPQQKIFFPLACGEMTTYY